jgi:hypothetical protein
MKSRLSARGTGFILSADLAEQSIGFSPDTLLGVPACQGLSLEQEVNAVDGT